MGVVSVITAIFTVLAAVGTCTARYRVEGSFDFINYSSSRLTDAKVVIKSGQVDIRPASSVDAGSTDDMKTRKTGHTATGSGGTVSWKIANKPDYRILLMWDLPYSFDFYSNTLAIGIVRAQDYRSGAVHFPDINKSQQEMYNYMYSSGEENYFTRRKYYHNIRIIEESNSAAGIKVRATMGTRHRTTITLTVSDL